eukprot:4124736-Pyramimonas_sp.AAC.1
MNTAPLTAPAIADIIRPRPPLLLLLAPDISSWVGVLVVLVVSDSFVGEAVGSNVSGLVGAVVGERVGERVVGERVVGERVGDCVGERVKGRLSP